MSDLLKSKATQATFAELVGVSRQAIQKQASRLGLKTGGTHAEWLRIYCEHLRTEAAGRGGDAMGDLTRQRISESEQKTLAMQLDNLVKLGELVSVEDMRRVFDEFSALVPATYNGAAETILESIESRHSITLDDELVHAPIRTAGERLAGAARKLGERLREGGQ